MDKKTAAQGVHVNIKRVPAKDFPLWQRQAWGEFLDMIEEGAQALRKQEQKD